jgi:hypothetical protein
MVFSAPLDGLTAVLVKKGEFTEQEIATAERFIEQNEQIKVYLPDRRLDNNIVERFVRMPEAEKATFIRDFPRRITPTTDDQPYFFNFTRWDTPPEEAMKLMAEATIVSQGNRLFLWGQLGFSTLAAVLLIVVPLLFRRAEARGGHVGRFLAYFTCIGVGFIFIEIAMIQKLTLLLGQPTYSIVITLFSILIFTGIGSFWSRRWLEGGRARIWSVPFGVVALMGLVVLCGDWVVELAIGEGLAVRAAVAALAVAPVAILLGMPFAHGVRLLNRLNPHFVPWAWAVNGSATVVGSVVSVIVSMNFGFHSVLLAAGAIYVLAFLAVDRLAR